jgi:parvulin-like peptidyl-prolyl isomerase
LKVEELIWIKNRVLDEVVKNTLLVQEIKKNNINIEENVLRDALKLVKDGYPEGAFAKTLELEDISIDDWEIRIKTNLLTNKLIQQEVNSKVTIGDKKLHAYFNENIKKFHKKEQVRALHIMVETEDEIKQIQKELQTKQKTFSELAQEFSLGPEGIQGGDLGYFEAGQMPEEFDDVFKLKTGKVSGIIKTPYGFHLFKVVDKIKERKMNFDESKNMIKKILLQDLQDKAFQDWFFKLKKSSRIEVNYELLQKIY